MQLEELQLKWQSMDQKIDRAIAIDEHLLRQTIRMTTRARVSRLAIWPTLDVVFCIAVVLFSGAFLGDHWGVWSLVLPAGIVLVGAIVLLVHTIRRLVHLAKIDWSGPVVEIQASLAIFRAGQIKQLKWILLFSPLVGFCCLVIVLQWLLDRSAKPRVIFDYVSSTWVVTNYVLGMLFVPLGHHVARYVAKRFQTHAWLQGILDGLSGASIRSAEREVAQWSSLTEPIFDDCLSKPPSR